MGYAYFICPLALVVVAVAFWIWPPKKINMTYGYRTTRSMKSQSAWDFAQKYSAKWMTVLGGHVFGLGGRSLLVTRVAWIKSREYDCV